MGFWRREDLGTIHQGLIASGAEVLDAAGALSDAHDNIENVVAQADGARGDVLEAIAGMHAVATTLKKDSENLHATGGLIDRAGGVIAAENAKLRHSGLGDAVLALGSERKSVGTQADSANVLKKNSERVLELLAIAAGGLGALLDIGSRLDRETETGAGNQQGAGKSLEDGLPTS